ncbi:hypothetical protein LPJ66_007846, partial [Kickxella alabastrina]
MADADEEFDRARRKSQGRFRSAFEAIFEKYGKIDDDDDIIDLRTEKIVVDNGRIRGLAVITLGSLLKYPDSPTAPLAASRKRRYASPELGEYSASGGSLLPELVTNADIMRHNQSSSPGIPPDAYESTRVHSVFGRSGSGSLDLDFAPYASAPRGVRHGSQENSPRQHNRTSSRDEDKGPALNYDSSESLATDQETPIDSYFTNSIEHYLDKLRQQLSAPIAVTSEGAEEHEESHSDGSQESDFVDSSHGDVLSGVWSHNRVNNAYAILSSPHTMSPRSPGRCRSLSGNSPYNAQSDIDEFVVSETCSQQSGIDSEEESESSIGSFESVVELESQHFYDMDLDLDLHTPPGALTIYEDEFPNEPCAYEVDDGDYSEEEETDEAYVYNRGTFCKPSLDASHRFSSVSQQYMPANLRQPTSLTLHSQVPMRGEQNTYNKNPLCMQNPTLYRNRQGDSKPTYHSEVIQTQNTHYESDMKSANVLGTVPMFTRGPIVLKPHPVAPHVFFECDDKQPESLNDFKHSPDSIGFEAPTPQHIFDDYKDGDSIHSTESIYEDPGDYNWS